MESLDNFLPKCLINIIESYTRNSKYDLVLKEYNEIVISTVTIIFEEFYKSLPYDEATYEYMFEHIFRNGILNRDFIFLMKL